MSALKLVGGEGEGVVGREEWGEPRSMRSSRLVGGPGVGPWRLSEGGTWMLDARSIFSQSCGWGEGEERVCGCVDFVCVGCACVVCVCA